MRGRMKSKCLDPKPTGRRLVLSWSAVILAAAIFCPPASAKPKMIEIKHKLNFHYDDLEDLTANRSVRVEVRDERSELARDEDMPPERLGTLRNGYGMPFALVNTGEPLETYFSGWMGRILKHNGIAALERDDQPRLLVTIEGMWIEGYAMHNTLELELRVELFAPKARRPAVTETIDLTVSGPNTVQGLLAKLWRAGVPAVDAYLASDAATDILGEALTVPEPVAVEPPAPSRSEPASIGCQNDRDCKGRRICDGGACTDPPSRKR